MNDTRPAAAGEDHLAAELLETLRLQFDHPELRYAEPPTRLTGGFWAEILAVRFTDPPPGLTGDLVARVMPDDLGGRRETVIQRMVAETGFPAPKVRAAGDSSSPLGRAYMVMDRSGGKPLLSGLSTGQAITSMPRIARLLPRLLARTALDLHLLDPEPIASAVRTEVPGAPIDTADMVERMRTTAVEVDSTRLLDATRWLAANQPAPERVCICHGDLHPFNLLVDDDQHVTLIDWSTSLVAEPAFDLAFTALMVRQVPVDVPAVIGPGIRTAARWLAHDLLKTYRELAAPHGIELGHDRLEWYTALHATRILTELAWWADGNDPTRAASHPFQRMQANVEELLTTITHG